MTPRPSPGPPSVCSACSVDSAQVRLLLLEAATSTSLAVAALHRCAPTGTTREQEASLRAEADHLAVVSRALRAHADRVGRADPRESWPMHGRAAP